MIELDLLADYAAGVLDGTPEGAGVERRIERDPEWARAYVDLVAADRRVASVLAGLDTERMPVEVAARIDAAMFDQPTDTQPTGAGSDATRTPVISLDRERRRRRWVRGAGIAAVAAGVVAFGAIGLNSLTNRQADGVNATSGGAQRDLTSDSSKPPGIAAAPQTPVVRQTSGLDYRRETLKSANDGRSGTEGNPSAPAPTAVGVVPAELARLAKPDALNDCVTALVTRYGGRVVSVDFARFEGVAALIAQMSAPDQVVVAGPDCGLGGADARYAAPN